MEALSATGHLAACAKFSQQVPRWARGQQSFHPLPLLASEAEPALGNINGRAVVAGKILIRQPTHFALLAVVSAACCSPLNPSALLKSVGVVPSIPGQIICTNSCEGDVVSSSCPLTSH